MDAYDVTGVAPDLSMTGNALNIPDEYLDEEELYGDESLTVEGGSVDVNEETVDVTSEKAPETMTEQVVREQAAPKYQNVFAQLMGKFANMFDKDSKFHEIFTGMAENLDASLGHASAAMAAGVAGVRQANEDLVGRGMEFGSGSSAADAFNVGTEGVKDLAKGAGMGLEAGEHAEGQARDVKETAKHEAEKQEKQGSYEMKKAPIVDMTRSDELVDVMNGVNNERNASRMAKGGAFLEYFTPEGLSVVSDAAAKGGKAMSEETMLQLNNKDVTAEQSALFSKNYVHVFEGMQNFSQEAKAQIENVYEGEEKEQAMQNLGSYMKGMVEPFYDSLREADHGADAPFLTDADREIIDQMEFAGVEETYSEHEFAKDMDEDAFGMSDFADQLDQIPESGAWDKEMAAEAQGVQAAGVSSNRSMSVSSRIFGNLPGAKRSRDYGQMAEARLGGMVKEQTGIEKESGMEF